MARNSKFCMNAGEEVAYKSLKTFCPVVLRNGWPDFFCMNEDSEYFGVEVKGRTDRLSTAQARMHFHLEEAYIPVVTVLVDQGHLVGIDGVDYLVQCFDVKRREAKPRSSNHA